MTVSYFLMGIFAWTVLSPAKVSAGIHIVTDFSVMSNYSTKLPDITSGGTDWRMSGTGLSWRWRWSKNLHSVNDRKLIFLIGPYFRLPLVMTLSNYGNDIRKIRSYELGGDIGLSWYDWARTFITFSPYWTLSFQTNDLHSGHSENSAERLDQFTASHSSYGFRIEFPLPFFTLESDPGDRRVEFGAMFTGLFDQVQSISLEAVNYSQESVIQYGKQRGTQRRGFSWYFGGFINVRI